VDLAILETDEQITKPYEVVRSLEVLTTGQPVWFMGWLVTPAKLLANIPKASRPPFPILPIVDMGTISAIDPMRADSFEVHFQGPYGPPMAGGPIICWSPNHRDFEILGVIKRNERDASIGTTEVKPIRGRTKSDILKGYSIDVLAEAIGSH
jgi:hypothetical protein